VFIDECRPKQSKNGDITVSWVFECTSGPYKGKRYYDFSRLDTEPAKKNFRAICKRLGEPWQPGDQLSTKCPKLVGKEVRLIIVSRQSMFIGELLAYPLPLNDGYEFNPVSDEEDDTYWDIIAGSKGLPW
jgi:hypothetical protein